MSYPIGRWKASDMAFSLSWGRYNERNKFGRVSLYRCDNCGPSDEETCWSRDDVSFCPSCGSIETHGENQDGNPIKCIKRYRRML